MKSSINIYDIKLGIRNWEFVTGYSILIYIEQLYNKEFVITRVPMASLWDNSWTKNMIGSKRIILRYILFQIPAILLVVVIVLWLYYSAIISEYIVIITIILWVLKDFILFFFVWKAYDVSSGIPLAEKGVSIEDLDPEGYVEVGSELWRATTGNESVRIDKGTRVIIKSVKGLTLLVAPEE